MGLAILDCESRTCNVVENKPAPEEPKHEQTELHKARAKIAAVEKVMAKICEGEIYDLLHAAIYSDQWEQSTHDELRDEVARLKAQREQEECGDGSSRLMLVHRDAFAAMTKERDILKQKLAERENKNG